MWLGMEEARLHGKRVGCVGEEDHETFEVAQAGLEFAGPFLGVPTHVAKVAWIRL
jgi:hypothetical protein